MRRSSALRTGYFGRGCAEAAAAIFCLAAMGLGQDSGTEARLAGGAARRSPLAYIRTIALLPAALKTPPEPPIPPVPNQADKTAAARWRSIRQERSELRELRLLAARAMNGAVRSRIAGIGGLTVQGPNDSSAADARLHVTLDRVGVHTGASREIWLRAAAKLEVTDSNRTFGPFYAIGQAVSPKWLIKPGYLWPDADLMAEAARQAARQLAHSLRTGEEPYFVRSTRVAVIPARIDSTAEKVIDDKSGEIAISTRGIQRLADVLFQPGLTPVVDRADTDDVVNAMEKLGVRRSDLWDVEGKPAREAAAALGHALKAQYVFVSRAGEMTLTRRPAVIQQFGATHEGVEIQVEMEVAGAFIRCADASVLWSETVSGSSSARTQFTKHGPRLRREDQCLADAARVGYAWLRSSFENFKRQYE